MKKLISLLILLMVIPALSQAASKIEIDKIKHCIETHTCKRSISKAYIDGTIWVIFEFGESLYQICYCKDPQRSPPEMIDLIVQPVKATVTFPILEMQDWYGKGLVSYGYKNSGASWHTEESLHYEEFAFPTQGEKFYTYWQDKYDRIIHIAVQILTN